MSKPDDVTQTFCTVLNDLINLDSETTDELFKASFSCNQDLADHETILVRTDETENGEVYSLSTLGIINSLLNKIGQRRIAAVLEGDSHVLMFKPYRAD